MNACGAASEWSDLAQVYIVPQGDILVHKPSLAAEQFQAEANDDVAVGDTILFTERLYVDDDGKLLSGLSDASLGCTKSLRMTPRGSMSVVSLGSATGGFGANEFVGERTVAAHVLKDSFLAMQRKEDGGGPLLYSKATSAKRMLRLEVLWSTVSKKEAERFLLNKGEIVERNDKKIFFFETFRTNWEDESQRKSVCEEWCLLSGQ
ncbi:unnamed protein product [Chrysoparadoxa australica]